MGWVERVGNLTLKKYFIFLDQVKTLFFVYVVDQKQ